MHISRILFVAILLIFSCEELSEEILESEPEDCAGVVGGNAEFDNCDICDDDSLNDCIQDCGGVWGGENNCGCNINTSCNYDSTVTINDGSCVASQGCNEWCEGNTEGIQELDCNDECGGSAVLDNCGTCDNDSYNDCVYETIIIDEQIWISTNLEVTHYNNGDEISRGNSDENLTNLIDGAYVVYPDSLGVGCDGDCGKIYGNLYNWFVVNDVRGVCPAGWHIPSDDEYTALTDYLGGPSVAGGKMKECTQGGCPESEHWDSPNIGATNESGFTVLPSGYYSDEGFKDRGYIGFFWSSTEDDINDQAWGRYLDSDRESLIRLPSSKSSYYSIRCIKD